VKITPSSNRTSPLYPVFIAMAGAVLSGCDNQTVPGIAPYQEPGNTTQQTEQEDEPGTPSESTLQQGEEARRMPNEE